MMPETSAPDVLIVEDDRSVREMLASVLTHEGYRVTARESGEGLLHDELARSAALIVLDIGLPGADGLELCRALREHGRQGAILMLTARHQVDDRVAGLDAGADDYLVKPFALEELKARVRAGVRRQVADVGGGTAGALVLGDLEIDRATFEARRGGKDLGLTKIEFDLLALLVANSPAVMTRSVIHDRVWGYDEAHMSNSLEVFVSQLRKKTETGGRSRLVHTVRGVGYVARLGP